MKYRSMGQNRHSFATNALNSGENPLWISQVMEHCNAEMIVKTYGRFAPNTKGTTEGGSLTKAYHIFFGAKNGAPI
jgi:integrase